MGTDIHLYVERKTATGWERVRPVPRPCPECEGSGRFGRGACYECGGEGKTTKEYRDRNYSLFAILADVRNDYGLIPIAKPRGLPDDTSIHDTDDGHSAPGHVWLGEHSFSHATLAELLAYDYREVVDQEWFDFLEACRPLGDPENVRLVWGFDS